MLSEDFDKKMRDAADHHHPTYDENAWAGMKKLLDKHMPEEKEDRRRFLFILFFFLLLGGGAWFLFGNGPRSPKKENIASSKPEKTNDAGSKTASNNQLTKESKPVNITDNTPGQLTDYTSPAPVQPINVHTGNTNDPVATGATPVASKNLTSARRNTITVPNPADKKITNTHPVIVHNDVAPTRPVIVDPVSTNSKNIAAPQTNKDASAKTTAAPTTKPAEVNTDAAKNKTDIAKSVGKKAEEKLSVTKKEKQVNKKRNSFFFTLSGGPDASFTGNDQIGRMKFLGGAGVGYTIREKFTLRTGFYSARKLYTSSPDEYHMSPWVSGYYPNLQKVEADCKVYEIPLNVSYNFKNTDKYSMFASAGVSSYIMKRETYDYYYKYMPNGPTLNRAHTTYNKNEHLFSVLNLSAGYQRNLGKRVSLTAEPYFKLPLKGVGEGKVKLNSGGVLFTISVKPFGSTEKR